MGVLMKNGKSYTGSGYTEQDAIETTIADNDYFPFYDASATAKRNSLWSNIKSVLTTYFDTLYQGKLTAGRGISIGNNVISASLSYSSTEKIYGYWTDGSTIYMKTVSIGAGPNNTTKTVSHGISGLSKLIKMEVMVYDGGVYVSFGSTFYDGSSRFIAYVTNSNITLTSNYDASSYTLYATLYYTKSS